MKDSGLMRWDLNVANEGWVAPDTDRVIREAATADDLAIVGAPSEASNLRAGIDAVHSCASSCVPEVNVTVV